MLFNNSNSDSMPWISSTIFLRCRWLHPQDKIIYFNTVHSQTTESLSAGLFCRLRVLYLFLKRNRFREKLLYLKGFAVSYFFPTPLGGRYFFFKSGYTDICVYACMSINQLSKSSLSVAWKSKYINLLEAW